ncbi:gustatory receptor [Homalodisca vitripennis]|nr:gustatory receptor [Homalodisca vitripennis]
MGLVMFSNSTIKLPRYLEVCNLLERFDQILQLGTREYCNTVKLPIIVLSMTTTGIFQGIDQYLTSQKENHELIVKRIMACVVKILVYCGRPGILIHFNQFAYNMAKRFRLINVRIRVVVISERLRQSILPQNRRQGCSSCKKVKTLMSAYHLLCDAMNQANAFYVCIFSDASFLVLDALSSSGVSEAAGETASLIRKQFNLELNSGLREQLKSTLLQLLNKRVEFSAAGCFQINKQTIISITAAVTTYLVIMIQFQSQFS